MSLGGAGQSSFGIGYLCIKYMIRAVGINTKQNNQENNNILFGRLEGSRITKKGVLGVFWREKQKMVKSFCRLDSFARVTLGTSIFISLLVRDYIWSLFPAP